MNGQYFGERYLSTEPVKPTDQDPNIPESNLDPFADKVPMDPALMHETPMGGTVAAVGPLKETLVHEAPVGEAIPDNAPMGETIADASGATKDIPYNAPLGETITPGAPTSMNAGSSAALINREEAEHLRNRWNEIQGKFVDEPRSAVQQADGLVAEVIAQIIQKFTNERGTLEVQWNQGNDVSTEDLRKILQHYRSFFNRLVV